MTDAKIKVGGPCIRCRIGHHLACQTPEEEECCCGGNANIQTVAVRQDALSALNSAAEDADSEDERPVTRRGGSSGRRDAMLKDQQSTGRKRAAVLYPLTPEADCEWRGLAKAGGGPFPIVGCNEGKQEHRHHGPDKNTLNNEEGNVHRICTSCHNRWHARNDAVYNPEDVVNQHDPFTRANEDSILRASLEKAPVAKDE